MRRNADSGKAGAGRFDAGDEGEQIVDGVGTPGVRVGAGAAGSLGPGGEVKWEQFAPGGEGGEVSVSETSVGQFIVFLLPLRVIKRPGEVEAEVIGLSLIHI